MESHGQRRRCRRGLLRGHAGAWWHGMRGGGGCGPWGMRGGGGGRFGCSARGRGFGVGPVGRPGQPSAAAAAAAAGTAEQPPVSTDNSSTQAAHCHDGQTNAETGEMASEAAASATEHGWTLLNDGIADVEGAATGVEQLHVSADDVDHAARPGNISSYYYSGHIYYL